MRDICEKRAKLIAPYNEFIPTDLYDDEYILSNLKYDIEQKDKDGNEEQMEGD